MGCSRQENRGRHVVRAARRRLLKQADIATRCKTDVGVKLLTNKEQVRVCAEDRQRRALKQTRMAIREVGAVDGATLSDHDRRFQQLQLTALRNERKLLLGSVRTLVKQRPETLPRRPLPTG